jgi:hypothetical protein
MKKNFLIAVGAGLLLIATLICACSSRSAKVEVVQEEAVVSEVEIENIQDDENTEYIIPDSILLDYNKIIDNFYKYRSEDSLFVGTSEYCWSCFYYMDFLLIFNFDKGTIQKVKKSYCSRDSIGYYVNYIKGFPTERSITGDFNGNGKIDTMEMDFDAIWEKIHKEKIDVISLDGFDFIFSDKTIPKLEVWGNPCYTIKNEGDLDGDGGDEIGFLYGWDVSGCRSYTVFTLKNNKWEMLIEGVFLPEVMRMMGIVPVEKDPEQEGVILVRSAYEMTCCACTPPYIIEKSLKVK